MQVGPYQVLNEIARGGSAAVYRARHAQRGHAVALKVLLPGSNTPARVERLLREGQALERMSHPNLMRCEAHGQVGTTAFLALTLVQGSSLQERLSREGPLPLFRGLTIALDVGSALRHAHGHGILHRDLKPDNVLVSEHGRIVLCDFGLLRQDLDSQDLTRSGQLLGTPGYWPPEQAMGQLQQIGAASDVYGLAALTYALLSGGPPRPSASLAEALDDLRAPVPSLRKTRPEVSAELDRLLQSALAFDPAERPSLDELLAELERLRAPGAPPRSSLAPALAGAGAALLLVALVGGVLWALTRDDEPQPAPTEPTVEVVAQPDPAPDPPPLSTDERRASIRQMWLIGNVDEARAAAQAWVDAEPDNRAARRTLGTAWQQAGDAPRALRIFDALLEEDPDDVRALVGRAQLYTFMSEVQPALDDLNRALTLDPRNALAYVKRGALQTLACQFEGAAADYRKAIELDPTLAHAHYELARNWHAQNEVERAAAGYRDALAVDPEFFPALVNLGLALHEGGRPDDAREVYLRATEVNPNLALLFYNLGNLEYDARDYPAALKAFDRCLELDPNYLKAYVNRGLVHFDLGDYRAAIADYNASLKARPNHGLTLYNRANAKLQLEDYEGALVDSSAALQAKPPDYDALLTRGLACANTGRLTQAKADYEAFLRLRPNHPSVPDVRHWLAEVNEVLNR